MAVSVRGAADPYLIQVTPLLKTCCNTMKEITNLKLHLQPQERVIHVGYTVIIAFPFILDEKVITGPRKRRPSGEVTTTEALWELEPARSGEVTTTEALWELELAASYTEKLRDVLLRYFQSQGDMMKEAEQKRKIKRLLDLKTAIDGFLQVINEIIQYYTCKSVGLSLDGHSLPKLEELKEQEEKMCAVTKHLNLNEIHSIFANYKDDFMTSDESILCALLGLDIKYQSYLENLDDKAKNHQGALYYIVSLLEEREHDIEYVPNDKGIEGLCKNLVSLGFTEKRAEAFAKNIPPELIDLQTPSYWAERYLEDIFVCHPLLSDNSRYPYSETTIDVWFEQEILTEKRKEPNRKIPSFNVRMFNCTPESSEDNKVVRDYLQKLKDEDKDNVMLYHGTTHANAKSILTWGITIGYGKDGQDFSSGDGFYLSEKLEDAIKWSRTARGERNAILVFKIKKDLIDPSKENGLDVTEDKEKWQKIVKLCRTQYNDQKAFEKLLKDITFIRGHICLNPIAVAQGKDSPDGFDQSELHICIRDKDYAVKFGSLENICCVFFY